MKRQVYIEFGDFQLLQFATHQGWPGPEYPPTIINEFGTFYEDSGFYTDFGVWQLFTPQSHMFGDAEALSFKLCKDENDYTICDRTVDCACWPPLPAANRVREDADFVGYEAYVIQESQLNNIPAWWSRNLIPTGVGNEDYDNFYPTDGFIGYTNYRLREHWLHPSKEYFVSWAYGKYLTTNKEPPHGDVPPYTVYPREYLWFKSDEAAASQIITGVLLENVTPFWTWWYCGLTEPNEYINRIGYGQYQYIDAIQMGAGIIYGATLETRVYFKDSPPTNTPPFPFDKLNNVDFDAEYVETYMGQDANFKYWPSRTNQNVIIPTKLDLLHTAHRDHERGLQQYFANTCDQFVVAIYKNNYTPHRYSVYDDFEINNFHLYGSHISYPSLTPYGLGRCTQFFTSEEPLPPLGPHFVALRGPNTWRICNYAECTDELAAFYTSGWLPSVPDDRMLYRFKFLYSATFSADYPNTEAESELMYGWVVLGYDSNSELTNVLAAGRFPDGPYTLKSYWQWFIPSIGDPFVRNNSIHGDEIRFNLKQITTRLD